MTDKTPVIHNKSRDFRQGVRWMLWLLVFALAASHLIIGLFNHYQLRSNAFDYAVYNFAFFDFAHLRSSPCPVYLAEFPISFAQDHFSLLLPLLSPLYWILAPLAGTYSLLLIQWLLVLFGAWGTYRLMLFLGSGNLLALLAVVYYFILFGRFSAHRADVNLLIMGAALVPVFIYFFAAGKMWPALISGTVLLLAREDFPLWLFFIAFFLFLAFPRRDPRRKRALILMAVSALFFVLTFLVIIPAFLEDEYKKFAGFEYKSLGNGPWEIVLNTFKDPLRMFGFLFVNHLPQDYYKDVKVDFYLLYLLSGGFILFTRPLFLLPLLPVIAKKMLNDSPIRWGIETYYSVELVSVLPLLVFWIIADHRELRGRLVLGGLTVALAFCCTVYNLLNAGPQPVLGESNKYNVLSPGFYRCEYKRSAVFGAIGLVPPEAAVSGSSRIIPHLSLREKVYYFPRVADAEFVCLLKSNDTYPLTPDQYEQELTKLRQSAFWFILAETPDLVIFKRKPV